MKVYIGSDHAGFDFKEELLEHLTKMGHEVEDVGNKKLDPKDDYPQFAYAATTKVLGDEDDDARAILVCGSGQGMCIAANRVHGIRASLCWDVHGAKETREDNDSNVLCIPARVLSVEQGLDIVDAWLTTPFSGEERHKRRIEEVENLYG